MSSSPYDPTRFIRRTPDDDAPELVSQGVEVEQPSGPVATATLSRYSEGKWFAPPATLADLDQAPRALSWKGVLVVIALGALVSQLSWWLGLIVFVAGLALTGSLRFKVTPGRPIDAAHALDRMEGAPSDRHWLVRVSFIANDSKLVWSDIGGLAIEDDRMVFASPSTAFVVGGQDIEQDVDSQTFRLAARPHTGWFHVEVLPVADHPEADVEEFQRRLALFLSSRPRTNEPRQFPPLRAFGT